MQVIKPLWNFNRTCIHFFRFNVPTKSHLDAWMALHYLQHMLFSATVFGVVSACKSAVASALPFSLIV